MQRTIDPLAFLRESLSLGKKIYREGDYLIFDDNIKLKLNTPTAMVQFQSKKQYTLGTLWFFLIHRKDQLKNYILACRDEGIDTLITIDKEKVIDYFINNAENSDIIDSDLCQKTLIFLGKKRNNDQFTQIYLKDAKDNLIKNFSGLNNDNLDKEKELISDYNSSKLKNKIGDSAKNESHHSLILNEHIDPNIKVMDFIYRHEKKSLNRNSMLKPTNTKFNYESLLAYCKNIFGEKNSKLNSHNEVLTFLDELISSDDLNFNKAIIVVPSKYYGGNLCYENAKRFLSDSIYVNVEETSEEEKNNLIEESKKNYFIKNINGKELTFEIQSDVRNFNKSDWKRVVAVFVSGNENQFNDWPINESITSILTKVKGFYLKYHELMVDKNVKKWNVTVLEINRTKRYLDVSVQNEFWNIMTDFLTKPRKR